MQKSDYTIISPSVPKNYDQEDMPPKDNGYE